MTDTNGRQPQQMPQDLDAERAVLGACILDNSIIPDVTAAVTVDDFHDSRNQAVFRSICGLVEAHADVEPIALLNRLKSDLGGNDMPPEYYLYVAQLEQACLATGGARHLAEIVREKARLRRIVKASLRAAEVAASGGDNADSIIMEAQAHLEMVARQAPVRAVMTGREFLTKQLPPVDWIIEELMPPGITVLVADPKVGKSRLATKILGCVATGTPLWDRLTARGRVLYIDKDESEDEMQSRLRSTWFPRDAADHFDIDFDFPALDQGGLGALDRWVKDHHDARLIVFDTWAKVRPSTKGKRDAYTEENESINPLKEWTRKNPQIGVLLIHHTSKQGSKNGSMIQSGSGSMALPAAASCFMAMTRKGEDAQLCGEGRRVKRFDLILQGNEADWDCKGNREDVELSEARVSLVAAIEREGPMTPKQLANVTEKNLNTVKTLLTKLIKSGHLTVDRAGVYDTPHKFSPVNSINSVNPTGGNGTTGLIGFTPILTKRPVQRDRTEENED